MIQSQNSPTPQNRPFEPYCITASSPAQEGRPPSVLNGTAGSPLQYGSKSSIFRGRGVLRLALMKWLSLLFLLALDVGSKAGTIAYLPFMQSGYPIFPFGGIGVFSDFFGVSFSLNYTVNTGAAWGLFAGHSGALFGFRLAVIGCLAGYLLRKRIDSMPLWIVVTGAVGNAIDYLLYGHVIDFLHFTFWGRSFPIFNFADIYISVGAFLLFISGSLKKRFGVQVS